MKEKIVITGIGLVTPFGIDKNIVFDKITKAESWIKEVNKIKNSSIPSKLGGEVDPIMLKKVLLDTRSLRATFVSQLTLAAGMLCLQDAKIKVTKDTSHKIGIFLLLHKVQ
jgi:3-oxoacyl-[acyl-carrier-protein] synthase II